MAIVEHKYSNELDAVRKAEAVARRSGKAACVVWFGGFYRVKSRVVADLLGYRVLETVRPC